MRSHKTNAGLSKEPTMTMDAARKVKLGQRWICYACSARFYDLQRPQPICPKCQADQRESPVFAKPKRKRAKKAAAEPAPAALESVDSETLAAADEIDDLDADLDAGVDDDLDKD